MAGRVIPGVDGGTVRRLRRGQMEIDATLDLHGMDRDEARDELFLAIRQAYATGMRCLLVITGKGEVLRPLVPTWLTEPEMTKRILAVETARQEHGGTGAFYVLVRRKRERDA